MAPTHKGSHLRLVDDDNEERRSGDSSLTPVERRQRDREWVVRLRAGDELALADIFHEYYLPLSRYVETLVHSRDAALDIVSDVFQVLWIKREQLDPIGLWPYLLTATRNRALDELRHQRVEETIADRFAAAGIASEMGGASNQGPDEEILALEDMRDLEAKASRIQQAYAALSPRTRQVLQLWITGVSYKEISHTLGIALKTVDSHLQQAKRTLRQVLGSR